LCPQHSYPFKKTFAPQSELLAYTNHIIEKFGLRKQAKTNQTVTKLTYNEDNCLWHVETESGESYSARFVIDSSGVLANPHTPNIKGAETFNGAIFHAGHWDHSVSYEGKRVGVIGSGCSGAQILGTQILGTQILGTQYIIQPLPYPKVQSKTSAVK